MKAGQGIAGIGSDQRREGRHGRVMAALKLGKSVGVGTFLGLPVGAGGERLIRAQRLRPAPEDEVADRAAGEAVDLVPPPSR